MRSRPSWRGGSAAVAEPAQQRQRLHVAPSRPLEVPAHLVEHREVVQAGRQERAIADVAREPERALQDTARFVSIVRHQHGAESIQAIDEPGKLAQLLVRRRKLASTLNNQAVLLRELGELAAAEASWREAMAILGGLAAPDTLASVLNNFGLLLDARGEHEAAIEHFTKAIAIQDRIGDRGESIIILWNLSRALLDVGRRDEAVAALHRRSLLLEQVGDLPGLARSCREIARLLEDDVAEADGYFERAMAGFDALDRRRELALVEIERARAWSRAGDHARAIAGLERAVAVVEEAGIEDVLPVALCNLADEYGRAGLGERATETYRRALAAAEISEDHHRLASRLRARLDG